MNYSPTFNRISKTHLPFLQLSLHLRGESTAVSGTVMDNLPDFQCWTNLQPLTCLNEENIEKLLALFFDC